MDAKYAKNLTETNIIQLLNNTIEEACNHGKFEVYVPALTEYETKWLKENDFTLTSTSGHGVKISWDKPSNKPSNKPNWKVPFSNEK